MQTIGKMVKKFEKTWVVTNIEGPVHHRFARSAKNISIVSESVAEDPNVSIPRRLGLSWGTLWCIFPLDIHLHPYKVQFMQKLKPADYSQCWRYVEWVLEQQTVNGNFSNKIFFSDKAHFSLGGYINKQNYRTWGSEDS